MGISKGQHVYKNDRGYNYIRKKIRQRDFYGITKYQVPKIYEGLNIESLCSKPYSAIGIVFFQVLGFCLPNIKLS